VKLSRPRAAVGKLRAAVVNSGNANCCTGAQGDADAKEMGDIASSLLHIPADQILVASTGIIGHLLPMENVRAGVQSACERSLSDGRDDMASAILTTDTFRKAASATGTIGGKTFRVAGICKGAGMIAPNMATMLAFLVTDAAVGADCIREVLASAGSPGGQAFAGAVEAVATALAKEIARDGEGATRLVEVRVRGAASDEDAERAGRTIAESMLVKCAINGGDPNWGRILAAAGRSGARVDEAKATVTLSGTPVFFAGTPVHPVPAAAHESLTGLEVVVELDLDLGSGNATFWTCDLSKDYVAINADYHT
jgi:glutamate N-acetyltransferase/amino-acid N-acetyltransferase